MAKINGFICDLCGKEVKLKGSSEAENKVKIAVSDGGAGEFFFPERIMITRAGAEKAEVAQFKADCCFECTVAIISAIQGVIERKQKQ